MTAVSRLAAAALLLIATTSHAARPTSIVFKTYAETADGTPYAEFLVTCDDGRSVPITAWDNRRRWCIGGPGSGNCDKKQFSAAKQACVVKKTAA